MDKDTRLWSVEDLASHFNSINFPEYQREPTVWGLDAKQRLIDSIARQFDIASIYLYEHDDGSFDCIDGRQRINAIMSFLGVNKADERHNGFQFRPDNEIFAEDRLPFEELRGKRFAEIRELAHQGDASSAAFDEMFRRYTMTIVLLSGSRRPAEFNLQFTRLNLGTIINSGEKLHAMVGDLRDECFNEGGLGQHPFLLAARIPTRRYARAQVAAQLLAQLFSWKKDESFTRTRHFDLSKIFKQHEVLGPEERAIIAKMKNILDLLSEVFTDTSILRNRAMTVSVLILAWQLNVSTNAEARKFIDFVAGFACRLRWQSKKGLYPDREYQYLIDFQRHLTQASVEKPAVTERARILRQSYDFWLENALYPGDEEHVELQGEDPSEACREN